MGAAAAVVAAEAVAGEAVVVAVGVAVVFPKSDVVATEIFYGRAGMIEADEKSYRALFYDAEPSFLWLLASRLLTRQMTPMWNLKHWTWWKMCGVMKRRPKRLMTVVKK